MLLATILAATLLAHPPAPAANASTAAIEPVQPKFILDLSIEEFSVLHSAADHGVRTYGGHCEFKTDIFRSDQGQIWQITISDPKLLPVWTQWMAEKTAELVAVTDIDQLSETDRLAYRVTKSLTTKLREAATRPIFDTQRYTGTPSKRSDGTIAFQLSEGPLVQITGSAATGLASLVGKPAVLHGTVKVPGVIEATSAYPLRENTLEVFVISLCPFGKAAEKAIIERIAENAGSAETSPAVEFRYLFLPIQNTSTFTCMHGEPEVVENLVQMVIRDQFPDRFFAYLLKRASSDAPWAELAAAVGFDKVATDYIATEIIRNREPMMSAEYAYWKARGIQHESPTYMFEGRPVRDVTTVPGMRGVKLAQGSCGG